MSRTARRPGPSKARGTWQAFTRDHVAASQMLYFMVSVVLFIPLIGGTIYFMKDVTDAQVDESAGLEPKARVLLERLLESPGAMETDSGYSTQWQDRTNEALLEAGIRHDTERLRLSNDKIENLQRGGLELDPDTPFVDYPQLKEALNVDSRYDFHVRMSPTGFDRRVDPFGTQPLGDTHVAYVGALATPSSFTGDYSEFTAQGRKEIDALDALGLGPYKEGEAGFTTTPYFPRTCGGVFGTTPLQHGTVVADTTQEIEGRDQGLTCLGSDTMTYPEWFLQNYFFDEDGGYRFDAMIFGSDVDLTRWYDSAKNHGNASVDKDLWVDFVEAGGSLVFMENNSLPADFVTDCSSTSCLFNRTGEQVGLNIPDDTNQLLYAPNRLAGYTLGTPWGLVDHQNGFNETNGFIPVLVPDAYWEAPSILRAHVGATSSDRYGETGGAVILSDWELDGEDEEEVSKIFSNLLSYGVLRSAYLDYGPQVPEDRPVRAVAKTHILELPTGEFIEVRVQLYLWRVE